MPSDRISNLIDPNSKKPDDEGSSNAPPAPPPMQQANHNPYDFITNPGTPAKKKLLPGGGSKKSRIIVVVVGALIFLTVIITVFSIISNAGSGPTDDYESLTQQQAELIRISDIGISKANQAEAKNLATTAKLTLVSQQPTNLGFAKKAGANTDNKTLALGIDSKTDALLTSAEQSNKFDEVFTKTLQANLKKYQATLKKIYDATSTKSTKDSLSKQYKDVGNLIGDQSTDGGTSANPATN